MAEGAQFFMIAIVISRFNDFITTPMLEECKRGLSDSGASEWEIFWVPGVFEIPAMIKKIIQTKKFQGVVTIGCVIKGETDHYEYICQGLTYGIQKIAIEASYPVIFGILTCQTVEQAIKRIKKGYEYGKNLIDLIKEHEKATKQP